MMNHTRHDHLSRFYRALDTLEQNLGGKRVLSECDGRMDWPERGVYFFFEPGEHRDAEKRSPRIVRVGTHALTHTSQTTLWKRLSNHRGTKKSGGGNHRGSIFRLLVGSSLLGKDDQSHSTWGKGNSAPKDIRKDEFEMEKRVSQKIGAMPFLWLEINDENSGAALRGMIERNSIALLSNFEKPVLDPPSANWLGHHCNRERVRKSGLWNNNHVNEDYDPQFLNVFESLI